MKLIFAASSESGHLARHSAAGIEGRIVPDLFADGRCILVAAQAALAGIDLVLIAVVVVGEIGLGQRRIELAVVLLA